MKKRLSLNLKVSPFCALIWLMFCALDAANLLFFCYGVMFVHECAHVLCALVFGLHVSCIKVYPFGMCAEIKDANTLGLFKSLVLYSAGPFVHLMTFGVIALLQRAGLVSVVMSEYLFHINLNYLCFNLLPIYPLDGSMMLFALFRRFFPIQHAVFFSEVFSFVFLLVFAHSLEKTAVTLLCVMMLGAVNGLRCLQFYEEVHAGLLYDAFEGVQKR